MLLLPFDAHNHVHMGETPPVQALGRGGGAGGVKAISPSQVLLPLAGMAIMSTHPRDYHQVWQLSQNLSSAQTTVIKSENQDQQEQSSEQQQQQQPLHVVPGFGMHPWWLAELTDEDWAPATATPSTDATTLSESSSSQSPPQWIVHLESMLQDYPTAIVGEIGLDGFRFDAETHQLVCDMERQVQAFVWQMELATRYQRPVSIHTVQCFGPLMKALGQLKKKTNKKSKPKSKNDQRNDDGLPPRIYFHAFGGKVGTIDQILALCGDKNEDDHCGATAPSPLVDGHRRVYFGFAPVINFRAPKTAQVMRKVGLDRLVLETDHEDAAYVQESMRDGIRFLAETFGVDERVVVETTTRNAYDLYGIAMP